MKLLKQDKQLVNSALEEDLWRGDPTTKILIEKGRTIKTKIFAGNKGVICGLILAREVFKKLDPKIKFKTLVSEGSEVKKNTAIAELEGKAEVILAGERTALNFIQHLSGISSFTRQFVKKVKGRCIEITDTRKTIPGLRRWEKYAVKTGGGINHRMDLGEFILVKDNHWGLVDKETFIKKIKEFRVKNPRMKIEIEVKKESELKTALEIKADIIMLDNMSYPALKKSVKSIKIWRVRSKTEKPLIEVSGGVDLFNIADFARLGVERISIGALTHSAPAFPVNMEIVNE